MKTTTTQRMFTQEYRMGSVGAAEAVYRGEVRAGVKIIDPPIDKPRMERETVREDQDGYILRTGVAEES